MRITFFLILFAFGAISLAQIQTDPSMKNPPYTFRWLEKGKTVMHGTEVTVQQYLFYLEQLSKDSTSYTYQHAIPESLKPYFKFKSEYIPEFSKDEFNEANKFTDPKSPNNPYRKPITQITYEEASNFAIWATMYANQNLIYGKSLPKRIVIFRLPTAAEYEKITMDGIIKGAEKQKDKDMVIRTLLEGTNDKDCALSNHANKKNCESNIALEKKYGKELYPVAVYFPNGYGQYDLQGNAAEMVAEKGKAMGGSYKDPAENCKPGSVQDYDGPQPWLGFRLIGEVVDVDGDNVEFSEDTGGLLIKGINK